MANRIEGPWCQLDTSEVFEPAGTWRTIGSGYQPPFACNDFWPYFEWNKPKPGDEMRLVGSNVYVRNAQKTLIRNDLFGRIIILGPRTDMGIYSPMVKLLLEIEPRDLFEFNVWWWPEYRRGETK